MVVKSFDKTEGDLAETKLPQILANLDLACNLSRKPHPLQRDEGSGHAATTELLPRNAIIEQSGYR